jgi:hypothetical protein
MEIITAEAAAKIVTEKRKYAVEVELNDLAKNIIETAKQGEYEMDVSSLSDAAEEILSNLGYTVSRYVEHFNEFYVIISWEEKKDAQDTRRIGNNASKT